MAKVVCLMGPTASGKTEAVMRLAQKFPIDVISVDSAMIYRGMTIGTAKPSPEELAQVPHALVDCLEPEERFSVADFCQEAGALISRAIANQRIPVCVGGTMMYFHALCHGLAEMPEIDPAIRQQVAEKALISGWPSMHQALAEVDPETASRIHPNDQQRIGRALEVFLQTKKPISQLQKNSFSQSFDWMPLVLMPERQRLHINIAKRVQMMIKARLEDEVRALIARPGITEDLPSMRSVGYRQWFPYFSDEITHDALVDSIVIATRQLAKRQCTWLRRWENAPHFNPENPLALTQISDLIESNAF